MNKYYRAQLLGVTLAIFLPNTSFGVTEYKPSVIPFTTNTDRLKSSLALPLVSKEKRIKIPVKKLKIRGQKFSKDDRVEPIQLYVNRDKSLLDQTVKNVAAKGKEAKVRVFLEVEIDKNNKKSSRILVDIPKAEIKHFNLKGVGKAMARKHYNVTLLTETLNKDPKLRKDFLDQIKLFLSKSQRSKIAKKIKSDEDLVVHRDLLPKFPRKMAKRFISYRGPNCFHAALAFHGQRITRSPAVNVKEEKGYHRAMINYDELWRAINRHFYEVDPAKSELKYGDMLVFFNLPKNNPGYVNFRWIRHTATYLFGAYTFSKGSKSPNTPYSIKTVADEWETWQKYTSKLGLKVFRRANKVIKNKPPKDLTDWIF
ncbi:MAG: hypothetical protein HRU19_25280 [Pseudobacteriovorax sp.]|nr:hypothetical protein [Pseudobacteriovorax sp.]